MNPIRVCTGLALLISSILVGSHLAPPQVPADATEKKTDRARVTFSHTLPRLNGDQLAVKLVEVNYGPGESSTLHSHPCPVVGYVVEGTLRTQVKGEPESIYNAGESFYEAPNGVHMVSANASDKKPLKLLAYFVCDRETALSLEVPQSKRTEER